MDVSDGRPWWLRLDGVPPGYHDRRNRQPTQAERRNAFTLMAVIFTSFVLVAAWNGYRDRQLAEDLRERGAEATARVVDFRSRSKLPEVFGDQARVAFETDAGTHITIWVIVATYVDNGPTRVRYLRANPRVARLSTDLEPRATGLPLVLAITALIGVPTWLGVRWLRRNRDLY